MKSRFDPFGSSSSSRWYRTGDLASFDGELYWLHGRADSSIKIKEK
ncbi:hypothetical protein EAY32_26760, partial [Vibrio anguillarum]|nr:hypothetical protein [Vibrio anguillarum]